jgi:AraC family transcriptional regulator of adaptative response/methylated-DNA-[protein]-cysteine methyltransferase
MIILSEYETALGPMIAGADDIGICFLEFNDRLSLREKINSMRSKAEVGEHILLQELRNQLDEYFKGTRKEFSLPLNPEGTDFQKSVWKELLKIPYGTTRSYLDQSNAMGIPESIRAIANANSKNKIAILIPCHRVIGTNGSLTGYAGGLKRKKWLLDHEKSFSGKPFDLSFF